MLEVSVGLYVWLALVMGWLGVSVCYPDSKVVGSLWWGLIAIGFIMVGIVGYIIGLYMYMDL